MKNKIKICMTIFNGANKIIDIFLFPMILLSVTYNAVRLGESSAIIPVFKGIIKEQRKIEKEERKNLVRQMIQQN